MCARGLVPLLLSSKLSARRGPHLPGMRLADGGLESTGVAESVGTARCRDQALLQGEHLGKREKAHQASRR